jgi:hypothetical protein
MKKRVEVVEVEGEGLEALLGKKVTLLCANYFYFGALTGVNETCVQLTNPSIIYETGEWSSKSYKDKQSLPCKELYVQCSAIESFGEMKQE